MIDIIATLTFTIELCIVALFAFGWLISSPTVTKMLRNQTICDTAPVVTALVLARALALVVVALTSYHPEQAIEDILRICLWTDVVIATFFGTLVGIPLLRDHIKNKRGL